MNFAGCLGPAGLFRIHRAAYSPLSRPGGSAGTRSIMAQAVGSWKVLQYEYVPDILEKRPPFRDAHIAAAKSQAESGKLFMAGAVGNPPSGGTFIWKGASEAEIKQFVEADPYVVNGLVSSWWGFC